MKYFTEGVKQFTEVSDNSRRRLNESRRYERIHGGGEIFQGGIKKVTEGVK